MKFKISQNLRPNKKKIVNLHFQCVATRSQGVADEVNYTMSKGQSFSEGGIYVHVPYCRKKCLYCDFFSGGASSADWVGLVDSLLNELNERESEIPDAVVSIYFGGGTPSAMPVNEFERLASGIVKKIGARLTASPEITIEINPEDATEENIGAWKRAGVNRASLGVESFQDHLLTAIGRRHSGAEAESALRTLRQHFHNITADLIFGLPDQKPRDFQSDLDLLFSLNPDHISAYALMYEPRTALTVLRDTGRITPLEESILLKMFEDLSERCRAEGFTRYEISNYSRPGFESRHNSLYWRGAPYLGLGPSAHSYDGKRTRRFNPPDLKGYLKRFGSEKKGSATIPFYQEEILTDEELREEFLLTRLRMKDGFEISEYERLFGKAEAEKLRRRLNTQLERGDLTFDSRRVSLSEKGIMKSDSVILELAM